MAVAEQAAFDPVRPGRDRRHRGVCAGHEHGDDRDLVAALLELRVRSASARGSKMPIGSSWLDVARNR